MLNIINILTSTLILFSIFFLNVQFLFLFTLWCLTNMGEDMFHREKWILLFTFSYIFANPFTHLLLNYKVKFGSLTLLVYFLYLLVIIISQIVLSYIYGCRKVLQTKFINGDLVILVKGQFYEIKSWNYYSVFLIYTLMCIIKSNFIYLLINYCWI